MNGSESMCIGLDASIFKKRKEREAAFVEMEEEELNPKQKQHLNENVDVISKSLEQLPDLYQATLFAFYLII